MRSNATLPQIDADLISLIADLFSDLPDALWTESGVHAEAWDKALLDPARDILSRSGKGLRARTVERAWEMAGGAPGGLPELLPVVIELLHVGSLVIDDIEDDSLLRRGRPALHRQYGLPLALNTGNWLYFVALAVLARTPVSAEVRLALFEDISFALMKCHQGQALDISVSVTASRQSDIPHLVATSTRLKTGSLMRLAALLGARAAGGTDADVEAIGSFGVELGVALQMCDDWSGVNVDKRLEKGREDIKLARLTWPWAWLAQTPDELAFRETIRRARDISIDWTADQVLERLRTLLAPIAPIRIRAQLDVALDALESGLDRDTDTEAIRSELDELERAYR